MPTGSTQSQANPAVVLSTSISTSLASRTQSSVTLSLRVLSAAGLLALSDAILQPAETMPVCHRPLELRRVLYIS